MDRSRKIDVYITGLIGRILKQAREIDPNNTLRNLSDKANEMQDNGEIPDWMGTSEAFLNQNENGKRQIREDELEPLAKLYGILIDDIDEFRNINTKDRSVLIRKSIDYIQVTRRHAPTISYKIAHTMLKDSDLTISSYELTTLSEKGETESHQYNGFELIVVQSGKLLVSIDGIENKLDEGDIIHFDASQPHYFKNGGNNKKAKFLVMRDHIRTPRNE